MSTFGYTQQPRGFDYPNGYVPGVGIVPQQQQVQYYQQPQQVQYYQQPAQQIVYQQPMQQVQYYQQPTQVTNFPTSNQQPNMGQCGVSFDQMRQHLVNMIEANQNSDVLAATLRTVCIGQPGLAPYMTGYMDKLVQTLNTVVNLTVQERPNQDFNASYNQALEEVYGSAWARVLTEMPELQNDPSIQNKLGLVQQYINVMNKRGAQIQSMGLNQNYAVQNVNTVQGGYPTMNVNYANVNNGGFQQGVTANMLSSNNTVNTGVPVTINQPTQLSPGISAYHSPEEKINAIARENRMKRQGNCRVDKYGFVIDDDDVNVNTTPAQVSQPQPTNEVSKYYVNPSLYDDSIKISMEDIDPRYKAVEGRMDMSNAVVYGERLTDKYEVTPNHNVAMPSQPHQVLQQQQPTLEQVVGPDVHQQAKQLIKQYDFTNEEDLTELFRESLQTEEEPVYKGLLEDEVCFLNMEERDKLYRKGYVFEQPYPAPLAGHPFRVAVHAILTVNNTVRQFVTPLEDLDKVRLPVHEDLLAELRENPSVQREPNRLKTFDVTTQGGVLFDRWKTAPVVLNEGLKVAMTEEDQEKREVLINKAFENFDKQAKIDQENYLLGRVSQVNELNNDDDTEGAEEFGLPDFLQQEPTEEMLSQKEILEVRVKTEEVPDTFLRNIHDAETHINLEGLGSDAPEDEPASITATFNNTQVVKVFNTPAEKRKVEEELEQFFWDDEIKDEKAQKNLSARDLCNVLNLRRDYIPVDLWERLNNVGTDATNLALKHIVGVDVHITDFSTDYLDLVNEYLPEHYFQIENLPSIVSSMDAFVSTSLQIIHVNDVHTVMMEGVEADMVELRTISTMTHSRVIKFPAISKAMGVAGEELFISEETHGDLYTKVVIELLDTYKARVMRDKYQHPINAVYVVFGDGRIYRAFTAVNHNKTSGYDFLTGIKLVRVPAIV